MFNVVVLLVDLSSGLSTAFISNILTLVDQVAGFVMQTAFPTKNWIIFVTSCNAVFAAANSEEIRCI